jgi:hypothetical protein
MSEHNVTFELFYDGAWAQAPMFTRDPVNYTRGNKSITNDTDPASGALTLDNTSLNYAPRSVVSGLRGKIGQNTPGRLSADGSVRITGEVSTWNPQRPIKGSGWTEITLSGVLQRLGRGTDPLRSPLTRAQIAAGATAWWPLEEGRNATAGLNQAPGNLASSMTPTIVGSPVTFGTLDTALVPDGLANLPELNGGVLTATVTATSTVSWRVEWVQAFVPGATGVVDSIAWRTAGGLTNWFMESDFSSNNTFLYGLSTYVSGTLFFANVDIGHLVIADGRVHHFALEVTQVNSTNMAYQMYVDGVQTDSGTNTTGGTIGRPQVGPPTDVTINPNGSSMILTAGGVAVYSPKPTTPVPYTAVNGYTGELAADRFTRLMGEEGITAAVVGTAAETVAMGPQTTDPILDQLDEIARTDDASIFETRSVLGLTMRTGGSKQNQTPALTVNYLGQIQPPLRPVVGDAGLRNDVTARNPDGSTGRVTQLTGPRNVQAPGTDPQGVGRYSTSIDVNTATNAALVDEAGWRVNLGTFDGTWYASVTVDLDAAPGLKAAVNAVDIGDVVAIANLPVDEALDTVPGVVIAISESLPPKRRLVTFWLVPAEPYMVGILANTTGDTDPVVGRAESDGTTITSLVAAGAASFQVTTPSGPLWTTVADDFPLDIVAGGQRIRIGSISGASSPQTFTVATGTNPYPVAYPVLAGAVVEVFQPLIATM